MFSVDPADSRGTQLVIEAALGLGEVVVERSGGARHLHGRSAGPAGDRHPHRSPGLRDRPRRRRPGSALPPRAGGGRPASARQRRDRRAGAPRLRIEDHYGTGQDIEWAIDGDGRIWIVQSRPITTSLQATPPMVRSPAGTPEVTESADQAEPVSVLVSGLGAGAGYRHRRRADPARPFRRQAARTWRGARRPDDHAGLGPDHAPRRGARDRRRRPYLPRRDREPRDGPAGRRRRAAGDRAAARRRARQRRRHAGRRDDASRAPRRRCPSWAQRSSATNPTPSRRRPPRRSARSCTSTSPSPSAPDRPQPCPSTGSGCCEPSSCSPRHSTASILASSSPTVAPTTSSTRWPPRCSRSRPPSRRGR